MIIAWLLLFFRALPQGVMMPFVHNGLCSPLPSLSQLKAELRSGDGFCDLVGEPAFTGTGSPERRRFISGERKEKHGRCRSIDYHNLPLISIVCCFNDGNYDEVW